MPRCGTFWWKAFHKILHLAKSYITDSTNNVTGAAFLVSSFAGCSDHSSFTEAWHYSLSVNPPSLFGALRTSFIIFNTIFEHVLKQRLATYLFYFFFFSSVSPSLSFSSITQTRLPEGIYALTFITGCYVTLLNMLLHKLSHITHKKEEEMKKKKNHWGCGQLIY